MMNGITRAHMLLRFPEAKTVASAIKLYSDKDVIVFCRMCEIKAIMDRIAREHRVAKFFVHDNKMLLDDGTLIVFKNSYDKGLGYHRAQFVMVDML